MGVYWCCRDAGLIRHVVKNHFMHLLRSDNDTSANQSDNDNEPRIRRTKEQWHYHYVDNDEENQERREPRCIVNIVVHYTGAGSFQLHKDNKTSTRIINIPSNDSIHIEDNSSNNNSEDIEENNETKIYRYNNNNTSTM